MAIHFRRRFGDSNGTKEEGGEKSLVDRETPSDSAAKPTPHFGQLTHLPKTSSGTSTGLWQFGQLPTDTCRIAGRACAGVEGKRSASKVLFRVADGERRVRLQCGHSTCVPAWASATARTFLQCPQANWIMVTSLRVENWESSVILPQQGSDSKNLFFNPGTESMRPIHNRMSVIPDRKEFGLGLDPEAKNVKALSALLCPCPAKGMTAYLVSTVVKNPQNQSPECCERLAT